MRRITLRLLIALITFVAGVTCTVFYVAESLVQEKTLHIREIALRDDLLHMRAAIDKYSADKGALPRTLDDLVKVKLLTAIPTDPFTESRNWQVVAGTDLKGSKVTPGIVDVHSASTAKSNDSSLYSEW